MLLVVVVVFVVVFVDVVRVVFVFVCCGSCWWCGCWFGPPSAGPPLPDLPSPDPPLPLDRPKFRSFFPLRLVIRSFLPSLGVFSWNFGGV